MELVIGTATFGTDYGIANTGQVQNETKALKILSEAQHLGISNLDTSPAYSNAEEIIGKFHLSNKNFDCYSKISFTELNSSKEALLSLNKSLKTMEIDSLKGLYFHSATELLATPSAQIETLIDAIEETKKVEKIGASVYDLKDLLTIHERHPRISLFQVPENIADRRLRHSTHIKSLYERGIEFHVRSIFLQGLLLMRKPPENLSSAQPFLDKLNTVADAMKCSSLALCVSYAKQLEWASKLIVGISESNQIHEILEAQQLADMKIEFDEVLPGYILDPRKWINV